MEKLSIIYNHSNILPCTNISSKIIIFDDISRVVINLKADTSIAIISIYIPVELAFDATLIESKGLFGKMKKTENCHFS